MSLMDQGHHCIDLWSPAVILPSFPSIPECKVSCGNLSGRLGASLAHHWHTIVRTFHDVQRQPCSDRTNVLPSAWAPHFLFSSTPWPSTDCHFDFPQCLWLTLTQGIVGGRAKAYRDSEEPTVPLQTRSPQTYAPQSPRGRNQACSLMQEILHNSSNSS